MLRPKTHVELKFANADEVEKYWHIVSEIIAQALGFNPDEVIVSDKSRLSDFAPDEVSKYNESIKRLFGVNVSHIENDNLAEIAKYIDGKVNA